MAEPTRVCVVGPGTRFLSGITYYTYSLIEALTGAGYHCSAVLIRNLVPVRLYPGRARVGDALTDLSLPPDVPRVDGVEPVLDQAPQELRQQHVGCQHGHAAGSDRLELVRRHLGNP